MANLPPRNATATPYFNDVDFGKSREKAADFLIAIYGTYTAAGGSTGGGRLMLMGVG